ncbi:hypothetical protein D3C77_682900 [compost metagenome]
MRNIRRLLHRLRPQRYWRYEYIEPQSYEAPSLGTGRRELAREPRERHHLRQTVLGRQQHRSR